MKSLTTLIAESGLSYAEVARRAGISRTTVSRIVHGKQQMRADTGQRLASALGLSPEAVTNARTTQPAEPEIIRITTAKITEWGAGETGDRQLPELVRRLIRAEIHASGNLRGPTGRETVQSGPDIQVNAPHRTRHIPQGESVWEVSTRKDYRKKATEDIDSAIARFDGAAAKQIHFIFVTTQSWKNAANWRDIEAKKKQWASVSVYDVTDLQAWIEEFTTVQLWFKDRAGISNDDIEWLETHVDRWCKAAHPRITTGMVSDSVDHSRRLWRRWRKGKYGGPIVVRGGSIGEALLLIQALIDDERTAANHKEVAQVHDLEGVVVHSKGALMRLVEGRTDNLVIIPGHGLENNAVGMADNARMALPTTHRVHGSQVIEVKREPYANIRQCLQDLDVNHVLADRLARASGGSPNALRRLNHQQPHLNQLDLPKHLQRIAVIAGLVGTWDERYRADNEAIRRLAKLDTPEAVDDLWRDLATLEEPVTWFEGPLRGVTNRLDVWLRTTIPYSTRRDIEDYIQLTQLELKQVDATSETKSVFGIETYSESKGGTRVSSRMLDGMCKGLILLREYAYKLDHLFTGSGCTGLVKQTVFNVLSSITVEHLQAISDVLPSLAEASPEYFLNILEEDAKMSNSIQKALLRGSHETKSCNETHKILDFNWYTVQKRTSLTQAYECLGWFQEFAPRAIDALANLADEQVSDHHGGRPISSLKNMLKAWIKGCCLNTDAHIDALTRLVQSHPSWGVNFVANMLPTGHDTALPTFLPKWRGEPDAAGSRIPKANQDQIVGHVAKLMQQHTTESMDTVIASLQAIPHLPQTVTAEIWRKIKIWVSTEKFEDRDVHLLSRRLHQIGDGTDRQYRQRDDDVAAAKDVALRLGLRMGTLPSIWIFDHDAAIRERRSERESWESVNSRLTIKRQSAIVEFVQRNGLDAIGKLLLEVPEPYMVGKICARCLGTRQIAHLVDDYVGGTLSTDPMRTEKFMCGLMSEESRGSIEQHVKRQKDKDLSPVNEHWVADLLARCRVVESCVLVDHLDNAERAKFWHTYQPTHEIIPKHLHGWLARGLASVRRPRAVLSALRGDLDYVETATLVHLTDLLSMSKESGGQLWDEDLVDETRKRTDLPLGHAARIEFQYFDLLERKGMPALAKEIGRNPIWLMEALMLCMKRRDHQPDEDDYWRKRQESTSEVARQHAYRLFEWLPELPGFDDMGNFHLEVAIGWTERILDFAKRNDRLEAAQTLIGQAFAAAGMSDEQEPTNELVTLLEALHNPRIEEGVEIATGNQVGAAFILDDDPGRPDQERAEKYELLERQYYNQFPRTARVMRLLKERFQDAATFMRLEGREYHNRSR